jgi:hypothetical protein
MRAELIVVLGTCLVSLGVFSANPMFPIYNRPKIFRGGWGAPFFAIVTTGITLSALLLLVWSFKEVTWYINILVIIGSITVFSYVYGFLPIILRESAFGPLLAFLGLLVLQYVVIL